MTSPAGRDVTGAGRRYSRREVAVGAAVSTAAVTLSWPSTSAFAVDRRRYPRVRRPANVSATFTAVLTAIPFSGETDRQLVRASFAAARRHLGLEDLTVALAYRLDYASGILSALDYLSDAQPPVGGGAPFARLPIRRRRQAIADAEEAVAALAVGASSPPSPSRPVEYWSGAFHSALAYVTTNTVLAAQTVVQAHDDGDYARS